MQARYGCLRHASGRWRYLETLLDDDWRWGEVEVMHRREASHVVVGSAVLSAVRKVESRSSIAQQHYHGQAFIQYGQASRLA